jgi:hypothetical protein
MKKACAVKARQNIKCHTISSINKLFLKTNCWRITIVPTEIMRYEIVYLSTNAI